MDNPPIKAKRQRARMFLPMPPSSVSLLLPPFWSITAPVTIANKQE